MSIPDLSDIIIALRDIIQNDKEMVGILNRNSKTIKINESINSDPANAPWIGVYLLRSDSEPHTTGRGWMEELNISIVFQAAHLNSSIECFKRLQAMQKVLTRLLTKRITLGGTITALDNLSTEYTNTERNISGSGSYFQTAIMSISGEVRFNATN